MSVQSIIILRSKYSLAEAKHLITRNGFSVTYGNKNVDVTAHYYRFRQAAPLTAKKRKEGWYYTTHVLQPGVKAIIMRKR